MMEAYRSQLRVALLVAAVFVIGTSGYWLLEDGWTLFDAFYMTAITISTVGYGEVRELSTAGRLFSVVLIFGGLGSAALFASAMAQAFVERNFRDVIEARRMQKMIQRMRDHYVICGFGDIGGALCRVLEEAELPFVVLEDDERIADLAAERGYPVVRGTASHDMALLRAGIERAYGVVVCLGDDSTNVFVTLAARELNPDAFIIARGYDPDVEKRMVRAGADTVVNPLRIGGEQVAHMIAKRHRASSNDDTSVLTDSSLLGVSLREHSHFEEAPITVEALLARSGAYEVLKIRHVDGSETHRPSTTESIAPHETALLLFQDGAPPRRTARPPGALGGGTASGSAVKTDGAWAFSERHATGLPELDAQLRGVFAGLAALQQAIQVGEGGESVSAAFDRLIEELEAHFAAQEERLAQDENPEAREHIDDHRALLDQLGAFESARLPSNLPDVVGHWLEAHIEERDKPFATLVCASAASHERGFLNLNRESTV